MNIRIVKNAENINSDIVINNKVILKETEVSEYDNINLVKYYIYNLESNSKTEILPRIKKYDLGIIKGLQVSTSYLYFFNCIPTENGKAEISVIRYNVDEDEYDTIYMFDDDLNQLNSYKRLKLFVINDYYIIVEYEILRSNFRDTYEGYLDFELYLYKVNENEKIDIIDENLVTNGIADMIPITDNQCVIKTGFSLLKDSRYNYLEKSEVSVEGISIINTSQLVADLLIMKSNIVLETMDQTYFNATIPAINKCGNYLIYSKVNLEQKEEEVVFYNYADKTTKGCISKNVIEEKDLTKYNIIKEVPYVRLEGEEKTSFYNLMKNGIELEFQGEEKVVFVNDEVIVTRLIKKSIVFGTTEYVNVYSYPHKDLLHREKGRYAGCIATDDGVLYLLTMKN